MNQPKSTRKNITPNPNMNPYQNFNNNSANNNSTTSNGGRISIKAPNGGSGSQFYPKKPQKTESNSLHWIQQQNKGIQNQKNPSNSNQRLLSDQERVSNNSSAGPNNNKPYKNHININLLNNLNNINQAMSTNSHLHNVTNNNGNLGNSMLQTKKSGKNKKDGSDFSGGNTANLTGGFGVSLGAGAKTVPRKNLNQKLALGNQIVNSTQNSWKGS